MKIHAGNYCSRGINPASPGCNLILIWHEFKVYRERGTPLMSLKYFLFLNQTREHIERLVPRQRGKEI